MSLNSPSIDNLCRLAGNKYALSVLVAKRAKEISISRADFFFENRKAKPVSVAAEELFNGTIKAPRV